MATIITLTTDFGLADEYVGVMKGVIYSRAPEVRLIDLSHAIAPQDIGQAAGLIAAAYPYFPRGTIHLLVVDPGVGSRRRIVLLQAAGQLFLAPDNGLLTPLLEADLGQAAFAVEREELFLSPRGHTFHGRDIFAPLAAHLATGLAPAATGAAIPVASLTLLPQPSATLDPQRQELVGQVLAIDHFGNLIANIHQELLAQLQALNPHATLRIKIGRHHLHGLHSTYGAVPKLAPLAFIGSRGYLEIAVNQGHAAQQLGAARSDKITISFSPLYKEELSI